MKLVEILDRPAKLEWKPDKPRKLEATAKIYGRTIRFQLNSWPETVNVDGEELTPWNLTFVELNREYPDGETYNATGSGGELEVFATAKAFLEQAIERVHPDVIHFQADKTRGTSRAKLYARFIKRWQPAGYRYRAVNSDAEADYHAYVRVSK